MRARLGYRASKSIAGVVFKISIYWPSGYLCAELTTDTQTAGICLEPGAGVIEFDCPVLPVVPGLYRVDAATEAEGQPVSAQQRCATLHVGPANSFPGTST
jgi:hypothetical protein